MTLVQVGVTGPVKGRLPHNWRMKAYLDSGVLTISSRDSSNVNICVDTSNLDEYTHSYKETSDDVDGKVKAKYDDKSGLLRFDSPTHPEFWIEVNVKDLPSRETTSNEDDHAIMPWSQLEAKDAVLTFWPATIVCKDQATIVCKDFKEMFGIDITPVGCVETLPDVDEAGHTIDGTGGRQDFFFFVNMTDVPKFAIEGLELGMRWWEEVYFNNQQSIYPPEFLKAYPNPN
jgi:hypothetical protein